jgi:parallel beta-helix repeat protein
MRRTTIALTLILALSVSFLLFGMGIHPVKARATATVYIRANGNVEGTDKILRNGNLYTLTGNIIASSDDNICIMIEKDEVVLDGSGYTLEGTVNSQTGLGLAGILLSTHKDVGSINATIKNLNIQSFRKGIRIDHSQNTIINCNVTDCGWGMWVSCSNSRFLGNHLSNNEWGVALYSSNNTFSYNSIDNSTQRAIHIGYDWIESLWYNSFDSFNTVDGRPVYYYLNQNNVLFDQSVFPEGIGYLAFVNCTRIVVRDLNINSASGIIFAYTNDSVVTKNNVTESTKGVDLIHSDDNLITENNFSNNGWGIYVIEGKGNRISGNVVKGNWKGLHIEANSANHFIGNTIEGNELGLYVTGSHQNLYRNNFIDNSKQVTIWYNTFYGPDPPPAGVQVFDDGSAGNFWSDYNGTDNNHDGIGDTVYIVVEVPENTDRYPLIEPVDISSINMELPEWTTNLLNPSPSPKPTRTPEPQQESFPTTFVVVTVVAIVATGSGLSAAYYLRKRKNNKHQTPP